jgi:hypothetical protein
MFFLITIYTPVQTVYTSVHTTLSKRNSLLQIPNDQTVVVLYATCILLEVISLSRFFPFHFTRNLHYITLSLLLNFTSYLYHVIIYKTPNNV